MTVFSQLAVAVSSGNWFSWWEEVQFSGCYKYHQCLQSPAMLLWQKLLKVFSLNSKSFGQPWQDSENIKSVLMFVRNKLGQVSLCSGGDSGLWRWWAATHRSHAGGSVLLWSPLCPARFSCLSLSPLLHLCDCGFCAEGCGGKQEALEASTEGWLSTHWVPAPAASSRSLQCWGPISCTLLVCELRLQVFSVSDLRFLMLWNIYTISY